MHEQIAADPSLLELSRAYTTTIMFWHRNRAACLALLSLPLQLPVSSLIFPHHTPRVPLFLRFLLSSFACQKEELLNSFKGEEREESKPHVTKKERKREPGRRRMAFVRACMVASSAEQQQQQQKRNNVSSLARFSSYNSSIAHEFPARQKGLNLS